MTVTIRLSQLLIPFFLFFNLVAAAISVNETAASFIIQNDRLYVALNKSTGVINGLALDKQDLLGTLNYETPVPGGSTGSGNSGIGPYLDCYCIPSGTYTPGTIKPEYKLFQGKDADGVAYAGLVMGETYPKTGQRLEFYFFLRDGETGLHTFSRINYYNSTTPFLRNLQEFRTLFRPNSPLWTHLMTNEKQWAPLPSTNATAKEITVQDATWYLGNTPNDPYVQQEADYFTKYTFQDTWRDHKAHGMYADGSQSHDGKAYGSWLVMNTVDTYFNGPINSDLTVDGIVYNYICSNHHGNGTPNITNGFDRTFGPQYYYFNNGPAGTSIQDLHNDALKYADPTWNAKFYDSIAELVPNFVPSTGRGEWTTDFKIQKEYEGQYKNALAVLSVTGVDFQDNAADTKAYQYWVELEAHQNGKLYGNIPRVKAGTYRLTVYADGIFGNFIQDNIVISAGKTTKTTATWKPESNGKELWRIGTPDKSSGEYKHGYALDTSKPLQPEQYRIYWAVYDYPTEFPNGVRFKVGESKEADDFNYVHWSSFGGKANWLRNTTFVSETVNNWTIEFNLNDKDLKSQKTATFTIQLAGAKTAAGNTDVYNATEPWTNLPLTVVVNKNQLEPWVIPYYHSSSCAVRSAVICYNVANKFVFDTKLLKSGTNEIVLSLPSNGKDYESAVLPEQVYVQYDALRLEVQ